MNPVYPTSTACLQTVPGAKAANNEYFRTPLGPAFYALFRPEHIALSTAVRDALAGKYRKDSWILDVGCGPGTLVDAWRSLFPHGGVVGIDSSWPAISLCRHRYRHVSNARFAHATARHASLLPARFDIAALSQIFIPDFFARCVAPTVAALKPGGSLLLIRPYLAGDAVSEWVLAVEDRVSHTLGLGPVDANRYREFARRRSDSESLFPQLAELGLTKLTVMSLPVPIRNHSYEEFLLGMVDSNLLPAWAVLSSNTQIPESMRSIYAYEFMRSGKEELGMAYLTHGSSTAILLSVR